jgi:hypothetical protein
MNRRTLIYASLLAIALLLFIGCSASNPVDTAPEDITNNSEFNSSILVSDRNIGQNPIEGTGLIGVFNARIELDSLSGEFAPIRTSASEDVLEIVDITNFLLLTPCFDCINLKSVALNSDGNLVLEIGIKHPFRAPDLLYPPTAQNRADLHVFNIEGTIILEGNPADTTTCSNMGTTVGPIVLANADGYSPYLDLVIEPILPTAANVHPYILHFDNFSNGNFWRSNECGFADIVNPVGNLVMKQGSDWDYKEYEFNLNNLTEPFEFIYAVGCTYGISAENRGVRLTPIYRIPQFNKKAAAKVYVSEIIEEPPHGFVAGDTLSSETLVIHVLDMNYGVAVGDGIDEMRFASNIVDIEVEIPGVTSGLVTLANPTPTGGSAKNPLDPLSFEVTLTNGLGAYEGIYSGLIKVTDSYPPAVNVDIPGDGISRVDPTQSPLDGLFDITEFATYAGFSVGVDHANEVPVACFVTNLPPGFDPYENQTIAFDATCSTDSDGLIILYEWDFDYDGMTFNIDDNGLIVEHAYSIAGDYTVALRVTDDGIPAETNIDTQDLSVIVEPPIAFSENTVVINDVLASDVLNMYGIPVGMHYVDSHGDSIYAAAISNETPANIYCVRSEDNGTTWISPPGQVNSSSTGSFESMSLKLTDSGYADITWITLGGFYNDIYFSRATSGYTFSSENTIETAMLAGMVSHSVYDDNVIYTTYSNLGMGFTFDVVVATSTDEGANWSTPVNIAESAGSTLNEEEFSVTTETDGYGTLHVVYVDDASAEIRYTQSTDQGASFSSYVLVASISGYTNFDRIYYSLSIDVSDDGNDIYVAYRAEDTGVDHIYCASSDNGGASFTSTLVDDATGNCDKPCLVLDKYGWIYIVYLDNQNDRDVRMTKSIDKSTTWEASLLVNNDGAGAAQRAPSITVDDELRIHVFFKDDRAVPDTFDLYYAQG